MANERGASSGQSASHYRTHTTEHTVPLHTLIFCTSVRWNLCILFFLLAGLALQVDSPSSGSSLRTCHFLQADLLLQAGRPFVLQVDSCFRIVFPSLFTYLLSAQILMRRASGDEPDCPWRLQPDPTRGGHHKGAASLRSQEPDPSLQLDSPREVRTADTPVAAPACVGTEWHLLSIEF